MIDEGTTTCCYANSEKHWVTDPQGVAWEHFHTLGDIPVFSETASVVTSDAAPAKTGGCCASSAPLPGSGRPVAEPAKAVASCCQ